MAKRRRSAQLGASCPTQADPLGPGMFFFAAAASLAANLAFWGVSFLLDRANQRALMAQQQQLLQQQQALQQQQQQQVRT